MYGKMDNYPQDASYCSKKNSNMAADISNETEIVNCAIKECPFYFCLQFKLLLIF